MEAPQPGGHSFQLQRRTYQTPVYEVWEAHTAFGQPVMLVLLAAGADRAVFATAVEWARRPDVPDVALTAFDVAGQTPWAAILPDPQSRGVSRFVAQLSVPAPSAASPWATSASVWDPPADP
jgi:hypothetical protein